MAKYLKKRRISLRDIIFKSQKVGRDEVGGGWDDIGSAWEDNHSSPVTNQAHDRQIDVVSKNIIIPGNESRKNNAMRFGNASRRTSHSDDNEKQWESDEQEDGVEQPHYETDDEHDNYFIMTRFLDSLKLPAEESKTPTRLGLPAIEKRNSRSMSVICRPDKLSDNLTPITNAMSCGDICPNRIPGTPCSSTCSTPRARRHERVRSPFGQQSCSSNADSESEKIDIVTMIKMGAMKNTSPQPWIDNSFEARDSGVLPRMLEGRISLEGDGRLSVRKDDGFRKVRAPSSLNVSPNRSPNLSPRRSPNISNHPSMTTSPVLSPLTQKASNSKRLLQWPKSANFPSLKSSSSNPTLHLQHQSDADQPSIDNKNRCPTLSLKISPKLTRSNPSLYVVRGPDAFTQAGSTTSSFESLSSSPAVMPSMLTPKPTPPSSPRPSSLRRRRPPMVKISGAKHEEEFDGILDIVNGVTL